MNANLRLVDAPRPVEVALDENDCRLLLAALNGLSVAGLEGMEAVVRLGKRIREAMPLDAGH